MFNKTFLAAKEAKFLILVFLISVILFTQGFIQPVKGWIQLNPLSSEPRSEISIVTSLNTQFQLHLNQMAVVRPEELGIKFLMVVEDSRCPLQVACIWEGQVAIEFSLLKKGRKLVNFRLIRRATHEDLAVRKFKDYSIRLIKVDPYPKTTQNIKISDYIVTLIVSKSSGFAP